MNALPSVWAHYHPVMTNDLVRHDQMIVVWDTALTTYAPPTEAHRKVGLIVRTYTLAFFDRYLKGVDDPTLDGPLPRFPEIQNYRRK